MAGLADPESWLTVEFWRGILGQTIQWGLVAIPRILVVLLLAYGLVKLLRFGCRKLAERSKHADGGEPSHLAREQEKRATTLISIVNKAGLVAIWILVGMLLLTQVGVNIAPLIAGAGILGLAVGFGAQELVRDVITGFFILFEDQVRKGDVAIINGTGGLVETMGLRTIVLRDLAGVVHIFQNGKIQSLSNMTKEWSAMVFDIGVAYREDTDEVVEIMREVAESLRSEQDFSAKILEPIEIFGVDSFGDNAIVIKARLKTQASEQWTVGREYRRRLKKAFDQRGIDIPFPQRTLHWAGANPPAQFQPSQVDPPGDGHAQAGAHHSRTLAVPRE